MEAKWWRKVAFDIVSAFEETVMPLFGSPEAGKLVGRGPSGDETKLVDRVAEDIILGYLGELGVNVVTEETGVLNEGSDYTVIVDPLDGSYNFISGIPFFAVSMAVFEKEGPIYAFIYEPIVERFYEGIPGRGAYLNGRRIRVRKFDGKASISFYTRERGGELIRRVKRTRTLGAIALELAYLASGRLDAVVDVRRYVRPTDVAAGIIIAREAGALVRDAEGRELKISFSATDRIDIVAVNSEELLKIILEALR
ncbi:bifunctional fructose-bisphosphatase/inositol-phosphate phosphatase [Pyrococcus yayanosii]|uniref:fructose-bisphosphatase n=1 Tax=Pyrococcus yayanosii (strain CH1 / JCM 16557) TaxID=529709 RepID=F8AFK0_PYRYC|nr:bifunctional fructose-bisphosphatase/inositol-phosphate phosphatase [Pyrococcus yayanosii]AEH24966.1 bifunctional inositol-1 monophosphatase/fructose-1,6-bisphosphatase [Pyrococcus yayanosii CH1]